MEQIGRVNVSLENTARANEFLFLTRSLLRTKGVWAEAARDARANNATPTVIRALEKGGVLGGNTSTTGWAPELLALGKAFANTLPPHSAFDAILAASGFPRIPLRVRIVAASTAASASGLTEFSATPIGEINFDGATLEPVRVQGAVIVSDELAELSGAAALAYLGDQLRSAVSKATDEKFLALIAATAGVSSSSSSGLGSTQIIADLQDALTAIEISPNSRPYLIVSGFVAKTMALTRDAGGWVFPQMTPSGGSVQGIPTLVSSALDDQIFLIDASQCAVEAEDLTVSVVKDGTVQLDSDPTSGAKEAISLWQNDLKAVVCNRWFGCVLTRSTGAAVISNVATSA